MTNDLVGRPKRFDRIHRPGRWLATGLTFSLRCGGFERADVRRDQRHPGKHLATCLTNRGVTKPTLIPPGSFTRLHLTTKRALYLQLFKMIHVVSIPNR
jgi:hypothetical protein